jgi:hypothetical protein
MQSFCHPYVLELPNRGWREDPADENAGHHRPRVGGAMTSQLPHHKSPNDRATTDLASVEP